MHPKRTIPQDLLSGEALAIRFWSKVDRREPMACWPYLGVRNQHGYGRFGISRQWHYTHRVAWALANGTNIPDELRVLHRCDNPPCCNPAHLFLGTQTDNMRDCNKKGRKNNPHGERHHAAKLTAPLVQEIRERWRRGEPQNRLADEFGVTTTVVCGVVRYRSWKHVP